jgi:type IV secretory pathway VirB4 component
VWDADPERADTKLQIVRQALQDRGFTAAVETDEATPAWFATHPGNRLDHVARTPQSSLTVEHLTPGLHAAWRGPEADAYLRGLPWLYAVSRGNTLIRVVNHTNNISDLASGEKYAPQCAAGRLDAIRPRPGGLI